MIGKKKLTWLFAIWATAVIVLGGALASYHQPFQTPSSGILTLIKKTDKKQWKAVHVLSGSCGCSQKVMLHLLDRRPFSGMTEHVVMIDDEEANLPDTAELLNRLHQEGFSVTHISAKEIPQDIGLRGVPLLVFASPEDKLSYVGGYGSRGDQETEILQQIRAGKQPRVIAVLGCAIGTRLRREADPFHLKY